jgi:hypothetical protein
LLDKRFQFQGTPHLKLLTVFDEFGNSWRDFCWLPWHDEATQQGRPSLVQHPFLLR